MKDDDDKPEDGEEEKPEKPEDKSEANVNPELSRPEKFENKLTPEDIIDRELEKLELFKETEDLIKKELERKERERKEEFQLRSGEFRTFESYRVTQDPQPYIAMFGRDIPFFKHMFRLADIDHMWDPNSFGKPPVAGVLLNEFIYRRFGKGIIPILRAKAMPGGERRYKFSQFLNTEDKLKILRFRDEAIEMMKQFGRGQLYEMRREYARKYNTGGFQYRLGDNGD